MNYMNIMNNDNNSTKLKLTKENVSNTINQTISLLTRKVNELNTELNYKVEVLEQNINNINDKITSELKDTKLNKDDDTCGDIYGNTTYDNNSNKYAHINTHEVPELKINYATEQDLNIIKTEISTIKSYTLNIYNEVIKMRNVVDNCEAYNAIKRDISNLKNEFINKEDDIFNDNYLCNSYEWVHTQSILDYLNI